MCPMERMPRYRRKLSTEQTGVADEYVINKRNTKILEFPVRTTMTVAKLKEPKKSGGTGLSRAKDSAFPQKTPHQTNQCRPLIFLKHNLITNISLNRPTYPSKSIKIRGAKKQMGGTGLSNGENPALSQKTLHRTNRCRRRECH